MDMASGLLSLKWNNHKSTFFHVLSSIRLKESYCDATIACDGNFYPVHKLILSTCSEYFEQIFDRTQCKHPVIVLKDIKSDDLEALMNYMYVGEVNVLQEKLGGLIKAAECLKIKGLAVPDEDVPSNEDKSNIEQTSPSPKRRRRDNLSNILPNKEFSSSKNLTDQDSSAVSGRLIGEDTSDLENQPPSQDSSSNLTKRKDVQPSGSQNTANESFVNVSDVKSEPPDIVEEILETKVAVVEDDSSYPDEPGDRISEAEGGGAFGSAQDPIADDDEDPLPSTSADYQGNSFATWEGDGSLSNFSNENFAAEENGDQRAMVVEVPLFLASAGTEEMLPPAASKHPPKICPFCRKQFTNTRDKNRHVMTHTGERPFSCTECPYSSSRRDRLRTHMANRHGIKFSNAIADPGPSHALDLAHTLDPTHSDYDPST